MEVGCFFFFCLLSFWLWLLFSFVFLLLSCRCCYSSPFCLAVVDDAVAVAVVVCFFFKWKR